MKTRLESSFDKRRELLRESVENFEKARTCDTSDDLTQLFTALEYAEMRNLQKARDVCEEAIERNPYNVSAQMLMALLFTAKHDYKSAMRLVLKAIVNFPNHYGLMVLRLRLESKFGRVDRAMKTSRNLLRFWQKMPEFVVDDDLGANGYYTSNVENAHLRAQHEHNGGNKVSICCIVLLYLEPDLDFISRCPCSGHPHLHSSIRYPLECSYCT